jgi:hypothetical protein
LKNTTLVMRFYWNAALYHPPGKMDPTYRGPAPRKGQRQRTPKAWATRRDTAWENVKIDWYGGRKKKMLIFTRTALWHKLGHAPLWIRYVITRDPEGKLRDEVFACADINATAEEIIRWFVMRWSLEVTFEEAREHLGMETQRWRAGCNRTERSRFWPPPGIRRRKRPFPTVWPWCASTCGTPIFIRCLLKKLTSLVYRRRIGSICSPAYPPPLNLDKVESERSLSIVCA